jgi:hypothetical protein
MSQIGRMAASIAFTLLVANTASARDDQPSAPPNMPRWDVDASIGLLTTSDLGGDRFNGFELADGDHRAMPAYVFGVGRFWTQHVKSDVGVTLTPEQYSYEVVRTTSLALTPGGYDYTNRLSRLTTLSGAVTYQFFENTFVHPYVSGGVNLGWVGEHRFRDELTTTDKRRQYAIARVDEHDTSLLIRPIVVTGCKSYFNERTFLRTEALVAFGPGGVAQATFRIGAGVDF